MKADNTPEKETTAAQPKPVDGLDQWNERLDENLEPKSENDPEADKQAKNYQEKIDPE
ncbi:hypothetical protein ACJVDH_04915 [Pedobacter sp. AW1-32]|uniref:hypothetical protein n=1 Tax=Pedobacter sp. AW1-32 TaxID=3383026 RepID=UPI003FEEC0CC